MIASPEAQLTTEGKLLCGAIVIAGLFEAGRVQATDPADVEADNALRHAKAAMLDFRLEAANWPEATQ
jgi:hypothetical protein